MSIFSRPSSPSRPHLPVAGPAGRPSRTPHGNVRRRGRDRWQARIYVGGRKGGAVHLGMYESETAAEQVARRVLRALLAAAGEGGTARLTPVDVWKATQRLAANGFDVGGQLASLLPRWVCTDGNGGYGIRVKGGNGCDRGGFETAEAAYAAAAIEWVRQRRAGRAVQLTLFAVNGEPGEPGEVNESCDGSSSGAGGSPGARPRRAAVRTGRHAVRDVQRTFEDLLESATGFVLVGDRVGDGVAV
jgi:hypothetical protein